MATISAEFNVVLRQGGVMTLTAVGELPTGVALIGDQMIVIDYSWDDTYELTFNSPDAFVWEHLATIHDPGRAGAPFCVTNRNTEDGTLIYAYQDAYVEFSSMDDDTVVIKNINRNTTISNGVIIGLRMTVSGGPGYSVTSQDPQIKDLKQ